MKDGYIKAAAGTPSIRVADCEYNREQIAAMIAQAYKQGARLLVLPELCITGYTCGDLFLQDVLLNGAMDALLWLVEVTKEIPICTVVGMPIVIDCKLYNVGVFFGQGVIYGIVPKTYIPNYSEFYEARHFARGPETVRIIRIGDQEVPFGTNIVFGVSEMPELMIACELCEDLWAPMPPSTRHALSGATVICNLSASDELAAKERYRRELISNQSARLLSAYIYADAGEGESTTDLVFSGHNMIYENGILLAESKRFESGLIVSEIDVKKLTAERQRKNTFEIIHAEDYFVVEFSLPMEETVLTRKVSKTPFIPQDDITRNERCEEIFMLQALGLKKRLLHTGCRHAFVGLSGGLDSTLALLVTVKAYDLIGLERSQIHGITMPGYGTTDRTYQNALNMAKALRISLQEISIVKAVDQHFADIGHDKNVHDVTYENAQARERTQILMDLANQMNGLVIGTGDLSELALGWATYNGDHMSMYGVNASIPKTLVRHLVRYVADSSEDAGLRKTLYDVLDTPVSPELLPPENGEISQKTEDLVGPYELHDFFLYHVMRFGYAPSKVYRLACYAFGTDYDKETILTWLKKFYYRFFSQQFKRSCVPDGPKIGSVALSPRGDLRMPSDACVNLWIKELETIIL